MGRRRRRRRREPTLAGARPRPFPWPGRTLPPPAYLAGGAARSPAPFGAPAPRVPRPGRAPRPARLAGSGGGGRARPGGGGRRGGATPNKAGAADLITPASVSPLARAQAPLRLPASRWRRARHPTHRFQPPAQPAGPRRRPPPLVRQPSAPAAPRPPRPSRGPRRRGAAGPHSSPRACVLCVCLVPSPPFSSPAPPQRARPPPAPGPVAPPPRRAARRAPPPPRAPPPAPRDGGRRGLAAPSPTASGAFSLFLTKGGPRAPFSKHLAPPGMPHRVLLFPHTPRGGPPPPVPRPWARRACPRGPGPRHRAIAVAAALRPPTPTPWRTPTRQFKTEARHSWRGRAHRPQSNPFRNACGRARLRRRPARAHPTTPCLSSRTDQT
jgi:hypothetical protein